MSTSRTPKLILATAAVFLTGAWTQAAVLDFDVTSGGTFTAAGIPPNPVDVTITHSAVVVAQPALTFFSSLKATETVLFNTSPPSVVNGEFTFTTFGGELLQGTFSGSLFPDPANPVHYEVKGPFDFTGGTGVYAGAWGGGDLVADIQFIDPSGAFGTSSITWEGQVNVVPEPQQWALVAGLGLVGLAIWRRRRV